MSSLRIALAQVNPVMGHFDHNLNLIRRILDGSRAQACDLVLFPELVLCGYPPEDLLLRSGFIQDAGEALNSLLPATRGLTAVIGYPCLQDGHLYNAAALLSDGKLRGVYHKMELPNYGVFDEKRYFKAGHQPLTFELHGLRLGLTICEDIWIPGGRCEQVLAPCHLDGVINISASPFHVAKTEERINILEDFQRVTGAAMFYVNLLGGQDELVFDGGSMVLDKQGAGMQRAGQFREELLVADWESSCTPWPEGLGPAVIIGTKPMASKPPLPAPAVIASLQAVEEIHQALVLGLRDYVRKNNFKKVVLGLSGGIDSAVTAALAVEALGRDQVVVVTMPSRFSSQDTRNDALACAGQLGLEYLLLPIEPVVEKYQEVLAQSFQGLPPGLEMENLQARIRGNYLMALSNKFGYLVLTTGNKSETAVGYCTLYGDMAGGFAMIKDVYKTTVYALAELINHKAGRPLIPRSVIERPPTAELRHDQKDEDSLPPYVLLDPILKAYIEEDLAPEDIVAKGHDLHTVLEVIHLVDRNEYKRRQAPPGVKITPKAFGRDRRMPITNQYGTHLRKQFQS